MTHFLGIDVGTSSTKAILIDAGGNVVATASREYPLSSPKPQWSEQDPHDWWDGVAHAVREVIGDREAEEIAAVGLTGQMHGLVLLDDAGAVLRPAILWNDQRTAAECDVIHERVGAQRVLDITGKPAFPSFTAPKLLWVERHEPDVYGAASTMLLPKDYVRFRLGGARVIDVADASGTGLFDVANRAWSDEMLEATRVPREWMPRVAESPEVVDRVSAAGAKATGLAEGTPIVAGAGDQAAEAVGCGIASDGAVSVALGTSGVVFVSTSEPRLDPTGRMHAYAHAVPGAWHLMGVMLSAGGSYRWFRDVIGDAPYETLNERAASSPVGAEGLVFLPYLTGERTPHADPDARGAFVGLTVRHDQSHLVRAVMEGVTFGLMDSIELSRELGVTIDRVRVSGGGSRSVFWRQMMADIFGAEVATVNASEGAAFGAAVLAGVGAGCWSDPAAAGEAIVREIEVVGPGPNRDRYAPVYERYRALYPALKDEFAALTRIARG